MLTAAAARRFAETHLGRPYSELRCIDLVRRAYASEGITLPTSFYEAVRRFRRLPPGERPQAWDVVLVRNHKVATNHVALMIDDAYLTQSLEDTGVVISALSTTQRVVGFLRLRTP